MLRMNAANGIKWLPKAVNSWEFIVDGNRIEVPGTKIAKRPFDRIGAKS